MCPSLDAYDSALTIPRYCNPGYPVPFLLSPLSVVARVFISSVIEAPARPCHGNGACRGPFTLNPAN